jgi:glyoxylase-like metal-dependent hydrolase (beta-lactamase superfamily II)
MNNTNTECERPSTWQRVALIVVTLSLLWHFVADANAEDAVSLPSKGYVVREVRDGLYWLSDGAYNTMFLVSSQGVIVVDPLPTLGARYLQAIAEVTDKKITHVIYSHEHTDHIGAASLMPRNAVIIAQQETADLLKQRKDPRRPVPTVTFQNHYTLKSGDQVLELRYTGVNHMPGNLFIYAPRQKVLMLVDVVYPGYMPYPNLGVATDVPGYIKAHRDALAYDFSEFVGGHVDRIGGRGDVEDSLQFALDLQQTAQQLLADKPFPAFLKEKGVDLSKSTWFAHDDYERDRVEQCYGRLIGKWGPRLQGADRFLRSHCWTMIVAIAIQMPPGAVVETR